MGVLSLPAATAAIPTWVNAFHFQPVEQNILQAIQSELRLLMFPGSKVLYRALGDKQPPGGPFSFAALISNQTGAEGCEAEENAEDFWMESWGPRPGEETAPEAEDAPPGAQPLDPPLPRLLDGAEPTEKGADDTGAATDGGEPGADMEEARMVPGDDAEASVLPEADQAVAPLDVERPTRAGNGLEPAGPVGTDHKAEAMHVDELKQDHEIGEADHEHALSNGNAKVLVPLADEGEGCGNVYY